MIKVLKYEFESEEYRKNIASPYYGYSYSRLESVFSKEPHVIMIYKEFEYCYQENLLEIYGEILQKIKNIFNPKDNFYLLEWMYYNEETRLTKYFRLWNELKRLGIDLSFFNKTKCSDEIKYTYPNKVEYRAMCQFQWQNIEDYFVHILESKFSVSSSFFYSSRKFDLNSELNCIVKKFNENTLSLLSSLNAITSYMNYFFENDDLYFIVHGEDHIRSFGINIIGNKKMIDELYEKVLKCFENEK
ncbi:MAG: hypothetical protein DCC88_12315 [Spirobacillus cienkowskii]|jgi:hypothetical protein|uniref:Uncharacterized protein n=1 Tax=Spirobacillus cienkowskii TaxID=495820 RepID=A0A369KK75_9BACT|nr:MAG: hypothetical protein DCC88_12315 [Spirobacillus cienkowskii]